MSENKDLIKSKAEISSYLRAATEIEKDIYTIESMCEELENKAKKAEEEIHYPLEWEIKNREDRIKKYNENISNAKENCKCNMKPTNLKTDYTPNEFIKIAEPIFGKVFWGICIGLGILGAILMIIGGETDSYMLFIGDGIMFAGWLPSLIIAAIANTNYKNKKANEAAGAENYKNARQNAQNMKENERLIAGYIENFKKSIERVQKEIDGYKEKIKNLKEEAKNYRDRIKQIRKDAEPLYANRDRFYSVGIVPPDYRTIDCVYVLDQIFRNDLADTMRDAVLLYEERTFRGDLIRGINNIVTHMDKLSSLLSGLRNDIKTIKLDVTEMCDNMEKIYAQNRDYAAASAQDRERLYEETKLHRFALEAIEESNKKIVDYIEK